MDLLVGAHSAGGMQQSNLTWRSKCLSRGPVADPRMSVESTTMTRVADSTAGMPSSLSPSIWGRLSASPYATAPLKPTAQIIICMCSQRLAMIILAGNLTMVQCRRCSADGACPDCVGQGRGLGSGLQPEQSHR